MTAARTIPGAGVPRLARGVRLTYDKIRQASILLAPERVIEADEIAAEILRHVDGRTSVDGIVSRLAEEFASDPTEIRSDVDAFLADLAERRLVEIHDPGADRPSR